MSEPFQRVFRFVSYPDRVSQFWCGVWSAILFSAVVAAQPATLHGVITDESGAVVPQATVSLTASGKVVRSAVSGRDGVYSLSNLSAGKFTVEATAPDLSLAHPMTIEIKPGAQALDLKLSVVTKVEKVTVEDTGAPALNTSASSNASGLVITGADLEALSDDPDDLLADLQALAGPSAGPSGGSLFIDGFSGGEMPPKAPLRDVRINKNPFSPEYDKLGYGRIEILTKPGYDKYRAQVDYNLGTEWWNSRNPYAAEKAPFLLNEFEGNAGGPLGKRTSFTVDAQRNMVDNGTIVNAVGLSSALAIEPVSEIFKMPQVFTRVSTRVDHQLSEKQTLTVRYAITHATVGGTGIGNFNLIPLGYNFPYTNQTLQAGDTMVFGTIVNETRFQFYRSATQMIADTTGPETLVLGSFNTGGSPVGHTSDAQNNYEFQNYTWVVKGAHVMRFGVRLRGQTDANISPQNFNGTFTFGGRLAPVLDANNQPTGAITQITSIEAYRRTLDFEQLGLNAAQIRTLGGGATQFTIGAGTAALGVHQVDAGIFYGDEWRVRPNLTLNLGLRYETQTNISDHRDWAPRIGFAWAPFGSAKNPRPKTVLRGGFGMFYDRFALANTLTAARYNGIVEQSYTVGNPDFYPVVPGISPPPASAVPQVIQKVDSNLRAPYILQSAITLERQLSRTTTLAATYTNSHGDHILRSLDINAPFPGSGVFPYGSPNPIFLMTSSAIYNQNQIITNVSSKMNQSISLCGFYVFNTAMSNAAGLGPFPANPYNYAGEYGPAATDIRHRVTFGGTFNFRWNVRLSPYLVMQSGAPFDITAGSDLFGTTLFNGRPGIAADPTKAGLIDTKYGLLDPNPASGEALLPRNDGRSPAQITMNLRVGKAFGFGERKESKSSGGPGSMAGNAQAASGRGLGSIIGAPTSGYRYTMSVSMSIRNLLNHVNPGPIVGDITSPLFGRSNQIAGGPNGEGFYETANNRRLEMQIRFTF